MRLLDLFCGAGGAAMGYHQAGIQDIVGIDINPQPNYPFEFIQGDALAIAQVAHLQSFDLIHASPPCQAFTNARVIHGNEHPDLLTPTREALLAQGVPFVIENVPGAPMRQDIVLCGSMFDLKSENGHLRRHRLFEVEGFDAPLTPPCNHQQPTISVFGHGGHVYHGVEDWRQVMGIDWMKRDELAQAIPPAYTKFIGEAWIAQIPAPQLQDEPDAA